jgi:predicted HicB family RNase H-like nuclease
VGEAQIRDLVSAAARNGSSLNLFVATALAQAVGSPTASPEHSGRT